jgi:hypothetical protein
MNDPRLAFHRTKSLTGWARLFGPQEGRFLLQEVFDGSLDQGTGRSRGHAFDLVGVEVQIGANLFVDPPRHDFPPVLSHLADPDRIDQRRLVERHGMSLLGLR